MDSPAETTPDPWPAFVPAKWRLSRAQAISLLNPTHSARKTRREDAPDLPRPYSRLVAVRDGTQLALDYWLPANTPAGQPVPAIAITTRYWRAAEPPERSGRQDANAALALLWARQGYALVIVDPRGSGASLGSRRAEYSAEEVRDYAEIVEWVARQDWCNGMVATEGGSYGGNAAELACAGHPAGLFAAIPRYTDFSAFESVGYPGGIHNLFVISVWSILTRLLDAGDLAPLFHDPASAVPPLPIPPKRVDADIDGALLREALRQHQANFNIADAALDIEFIDDAAGNSGISRGDISLYRYRQAIESSGVPQYAWASWLDAGTADGALNRFVSCPTLPMRLIIGAWSHMTANPGDPYGRLAVPPLADLVEDYARFLRDVTADQERSTRREIRYYTLREDKWKTARTWPPAGQVYRSWHFQPGNGLAGAAPEQRAGDNGHDDYRTNLNATTGSQNRWHTQVGAGPVVYPDRRDEDRKLLCYTSAPLMADLEITGHPLLTLYLASDRDDAAVFAYLEEVAPDGTVTYLTEGELRALHRKASADTPPFRSVGPYRTFRRADALPLVPEEIAELSFRMLPVSVLVPRGHALRVALSGADIDTFAVYPDETAQSWRVFRSGQHASRIDLPVMERN